MNIVTQFAAADDYDRDLYFQAMFEGAAIGIGICTLDGRILEANPALGRILGYSPPELAGAHPRDLFAETDPAVHAQLLPDVHLPWNVEADGDFYPYNFSPDERWLGKLLRGERDSIEVEKRYRRKDGSQLWGHLTVSLARDARREPAFLIAMLADATERKRVDEHMREAEKMEVIGRLAGGIAHDFNNLLTGILLYCDLLSAGLEKKRLGTQRSNQEHPENGSVSSADLGPDELCQHVEEVRLAGEQGAALTHQLLAIARKQAAEPRPVLLNEVVTSTENLLRRLLGEQIELVLLLDPELDGPHGMVLADPPQLRQILMNLALNARDAMPTKITLGTRPSDFPAEVPRSTRRAILLAVKDNGHGMDAATQAHLFEPFFTTKNPGQGTGLGLATVERIVSSAGGTIEVRSQPGLGTSIDVLFPAIEVLSEVLSEDLSELHVEDHNQSSRANAPSCPSPIAASAPEMCPNAVNVGFAASRKTILLADDHVAARKSMHDVLLHAGHHILAVGTGQEALQAFAELDGAVDLLITDCVMPGMNGPELAETLRRQKPGLKVLLISGYEQRPVGFPAGTLALIRKPFSRSTFLERVIEIMQSP
ncbi:MAG: PAS domain S-box protein [Terriglobales bacterium]|jgi:signal transduction histidine kinase